jgi:hypothetical protein
MSKARPRRQSIANSCDDKVAELWYNMSNE